MKKHRLFILLLAGSCIALLGAMVDPAQTAALQTPEPPPDSIPEEASFDISNWPTLLEESFDDNENNWFEGHEENDYLIGEWQIRDGVYQGDVKALRDVSHRQLPDMESVGDFHLSIDADCIDCPDDATYAIVFRYDEQDNFYVFNVREQGSFSMFLHHDGEWTEIVPWTASDVIHSQSNRLSVIALGQHFSLEINGNPVAEVQDSTLRIGSVGVGIELGQAGEQGLLQFDNLSLHGLPTGAVSYQRLYTDDFNDPNSGWDDFAWDGGFNRYEEGAYVIKAWQPGINYDILPQVLAQDVGLEVAAKLIGGPANGISSYGLLCNYGETEQGIRGYFAAITSDGQVSIVKREPQAGYIPLLPWTGSLAINKGLALNTLQLDCAGGRIAFTVNDTLVGEVVDDTYSSGRIGMYIETYEGSLDPPTEVHFDDLSLEVSVREDETRVLKRQADAALWEGDVTLAQKKLSQLIRILNLAQDVQGEALAHERLAEVCVQLGEPEQALQAYETAVQKFESIGDFESAALILGQALPEVLEALYDFDGVLTSLERALDLWHKAGDRGWEAETHNSIGIVLLRQSEFQEGMPHFRQALEIWRALDDPINESRALNNIGAVYGNMGDDEQSLFFFEQALAIALELDDSWREAIWRANIGETYLSMGDVEQALIYFQQARTRFEQVDEPRVYYEAGNLINLGLAQIETQDYDSAKRNLQIALELMQQAQMPYGEANAQWSLGRCAMEMGDLVEALQYARRSLELSRSVGHAAGEASALELLGEIQEHMGQEQDALDTYLQTVDVLESMFGEVKVGAFESALAGQSADVYLRAVRLLIKDGQSSQAFDLVERSRARSFLNGMGNKRPTLAGETNVALLIQEEQLRREITSLEQSLQSQQSLESGERDADQLQGTQAQLHLKQSAYRDLLIQIELANPELSSLVTIPSIPLKEIQSRLGEDTTLLAYTLTDHEAYAFVIGRDQFDLFELPATSADITNAVQVFRHVGMARLEDPYPKSLQDLYAWLVAPLLDHLHSSQVGIVPHQALHYVPFAALSDGREVFGEGHVLFSLPSTSALMYIDDERGMIPGSALVLGNPTTDNPDLPSLSFAEQEAMRVAALLETQAATAERATESLLREQSGAASAVHIAAHGSYSPTAPLFSRLWLTPDDDNDGGLHVHEVYELDLATTDLVVLSACQTQMGELSRGDDVVGLNRAFLYHSPSVLASLWSVDDEATGTLMESFYRHLGEGKSKAQALQSAQDDIRNDPEHPEWAHPYYWAAFVLNGDPGEMDPGTVTGSSASRGRYGLYMGIAIGVIGMVVLLILFRRRHRNIR